MDSILTTIKELLGLTSDYNKFDSELIVQINSVLMILSQLGVGGSRPFQITGSEETWSDFLGDDIDRYAGVKVYIYYKVKLNWDPPTSSGIIQSMERTIAEFESRLNIQAEFFDDSDEGDASSEASL